MALLKMRCCLMGLSLIAACADTEELGRAHGWLKACNGAAACAATRSEPFGVQAYFDTRVSRYAPRGFYAYFELERDDGTLGVLELDVPIDSGSESVSGERVSYRELDGDHIRFASQQVVGEVQLPRALVQEDAYACGCEDGLFNLRFSAPGPDGQLGTPDDLTRELSYGRLSRTNEPCGPQPAQTELDGSLRVQVRECFEPTAAAPVTRAPTAPPAERTHGSSVCSYPECYREDGSYTVVESGCGGATYHDSGCGGTSETGGCGGSDGGSDHDYHDYHDYDDSSTRDSSSGCGEDSSGDDAHADNSGCEGDTSNASSSSSCSTARVYRRDVRAFLGTGLPLLLVCAWQANRSRQLRSRMRKRADDSEDTH